MIRVKPTSIAHARLIPWLIGGTLIAVLSIEFLLIRPRRAEAARLDEALQEVQNDIAAHTHPPEQNAVETRLQRQQRMNQRLMEEWEDKKVRVRTFREGSALTDILSPSIEGRIDFKVALFEARQRLGEMARVRNVALPADLGIPDAIGAEEDAEIRLGQLAATVLLLEKCMEHDIPTITRVRALSPNEVDVYDEEYRRVTFYPVRIHMTCSYDQLLDIVEALMEPDSFFSLRHVHTTSGFPDNPDELDVRIEWAAVAFTPKRRVSQRVAPPPLYEGDLFY